MTITRLVGTVILLLSLSLQAANLEIPVLKVGPETYRNVKVIGFNSTDVYFNHDKGIGNVKLKYLDPDLQKRLNFDPKAAAAAEQKQAEADVLYHSVVASNIVLQAQKARVEGASAANEPITFADPVSDKSLLGKAAPVLEPEQWLGDKPALDGKYVLVSFWSPWSAASRQCIPELNALQKKFADKLVVVGIAPTAEIEDSPKPDFACATDSKAKLTAAAGVTSIPAVLLVDPKGIVCYQGHPAAITEKKLEALFAKPSE